MTISKKVFIFTAEIIKNTEELKLEKDKYNKLTFPPSFERGKVCFYKITNPNLAQVGQDWDFIVLKEIPLNKVDKKGQPMFLREVELTKQLPIGYSSWELEDKKEFVRTVYYGTHKEIERVPVERTYTSLQRKTGNGLGNYVAFDWFENRHYYNQKHNLYKPDCNLFCKLVYNEGKFTFRVNDKSLYKKYRDQVTSFIKNEVVPKYRHIHQLPFEASILIQIYRNNFNMVQDKDNIFRRYIEVNGGKYVVPKWLEFVWTTYPYEIERKYRKGKVTLSKSEIVSAL